uniref:Serpentine Receptor, class H n=1 Tax=Caenorhabditis tropicalis TaxID=1561998 RepID=A0A1I7UBD5_9PELO
MEWQDYNASDCRDNYSYFGSADYLRNAYHITAFFTLPLSFFTFYVIAKVTPRRMRNMKAPMMIAHAWSTNLDLMFTVYSAPYIFFPSASGVPLGLLGALGVGVKWQSYWGQVSVSMMGISIVMLYENRHSQISTIKYFKITRKRTRLILFGLNYAFAFVVNVPFYLDNTDQVEMRKIVLERIPCPTIEFWDPKTYVLLKGGEVLPFWSITIGFGSVIVQCLFFFIPTVYHLTVVTTGQVSGATKNLQRKFLKYVSIQVSIPWIAIALPAGFSMYCDKTNFYNQAYNNNAMLMMANHGFLSTACTLFVYKPYRDFVISVVTGKKDDKKSSITVVGSIASSI